MVGSLVARRSLYNNQLTGEIPNLNKLTSLTILQVCVCVRVCICGRDDLACAVH